MMALCPIYSIHYKSEVIPFSGNKKPSQQKQLQERIFPDDTVEVAKGKIALQLGLKNGDHLYLWTKTKLDVVDFVELFIDDLFWKGKVSFIEFSRALRCISNIDVMDTDTDADADAEGAGAVKSLSRDEARSLLMTRITSPPLLYQTLGFKKVFMGNTRVFFPVDPQSADADEADELKYDGGEGDLVDESARLIESYKCENNVIYAVVSNNLTSDKSGLQQIYSFQPREKLLTNLYSTTDSKLSEACQLAASDKSDKSDSRYISYIHLSETRAIDVASGSSGSAVDANAGTGIAGSSTGMRQLFSRMSPTAEVPFIKWVNVSETNFKVYKEFLLQTNNEYRLTTWTQPLIKNVEQRKMRINVKERIVVKVLVPKSFVATIYFNVDGKYDVKINFLKVSNVTFENVSTIIANLNSVLKTMFHDYTYPMDPNFWKFPDFICHTQMLKIKCHGSFPIPFQSSTLDIHQIKEVALRTMSPFFIPISTEDGSTTLLYKRINFYSSDENIKQHLIKFSKDKTKDEAAKILTAKFIEQTFNISVERAARLHHDWLTSSTNIYYSLSRMKIATVAIRPTGSSYPFHIEGNMSLPQIDMLIQMLKYMVGKKGEATNANAINGEKNAKGVKTKVAKDGLDNFWGDDGDDDGDGEGDGDDDGDGGEGNGDGEGEGVDGDDGGEYIDASKVNSVIKQMKDDMICPSKKIKEATASDYNAPKVDAAKCWTTEHLEPLNPLDVDPMTGGDALLNNLKRADQALFNFQDENNSESTYAKKCQASSLQMPVVLSPKEQLYNDKCFPKALNGVVSYGSTPELKDKNIYGCPKVWCPKSRVALTLEQYEKLGKKCPFSEVEEDAMLFNSGDFKNKDRYIGFVPETITEIPGQCAPCCFKKKGKDSDKSGNEAYIMTEKVPLEKGRYGVLSDPLTKFFDNRFCGQSNGKHGMIELKTNCYLRYGIAMSKQPFLQSIVSCFNPTGVRSTIALIDLICQRLTMKMYLTLNHGLVCKAFLPNYTASSSSAMSPNEAASSLDEFNAFKRVFLHKSNLDYVKSFNLDSMYNTLLSATHYTEDLQDFKEILREFQLFSSMSNFIKFLRDDKITKSHEHILDLVERADWINEKRRNLIIINMNAAGEGVLEAPVFQHVNRFDKDYATVVLIKQKRYYEPLHWIVHKKTDRKKEHSWRDNVRMKRLVDLYHGIGRNGDGSIAEQDTFFDPNASNLEVLLNSDQKRSKFKIVKHLINYNFHVVAFVTAKDLIVPLRKPTPMNLESVDKWEFVDSFLKKFRGSSSKDDVAMLFTIVNQKFPGYYPHEARTAGSVATILPHPFLVRGIPLKGYDATQEVKQLSEFSDLMKDREVFILYQQDDARVTFMKEKQYQDRILLTLRNEAIQLILNKPYLFKYVGMLRHRSNPWPLNVREKYLSNEIGPFLKEVVYKFNLENMPDDPNKSRLIKQQKKNQGRDGLCSSISEQGACVDPCKWVISTKVAKAAKGVKEKAGAKSSGFCKIGIPLDQYDTMLKRTVVHLLNPFNPLEIEKWGGDFNNDYVSFDSQQVAETNGLQKIFKRYMNVGATSYEIVQNDVVYEDGNDNGDSDGEPDLSEAALAPTPASLKKTELEGFGLYKQSKNWLLPFFAHIDHKLKLGTAKIGKGLSVEQLYKVVLKKMKIDLLEEDSTSTKRGPQSNITISKILKSKRSKGISVDDILQHPDYMPSLYELGILCDVVGVNMYVINRKTKAIEGTSHCLPCKNKSYLYLFMNMHSTIESNTVEFQLYAKDFKYIFDIRATDAEHVFDEKFRKCLISKCSASASAPSSPSAGNGCLS